MSGLGQWSNYDTLRIYEAIIAGQNPNTGFYYDYLTDSGSYLTLLQNLNQTIIPRETAYYIPDPITNPVKNRIRVELSGRLTAAGTIYTVPNGWTLKVTAISVQGINTAATVGFFTVRVGVGGAVKFHGSATAAVANSNSVLQLPTLNVPITWTQNSLVHIAFDAGTYTTTGIVFNIYGFIEEI